ncbi:MAG: alpha-galactosidase [Acidimicrobiales bacterium]|nr:alpha-galactosidase [Acidimicrobiales bacterium]
MKLALDRIEVDGGGSVRLAGPWGRDEGLRGFSTTFTGPERWPDGTLPAGAEGERWSWSVAEDGGTPRPVRSASVVFRVVDAHGPLRMFRHGYQSWSPCGTAVFGVDHDPSTAPGSLELLSGAHQADQRRVVDPEELRSEWVTVLVDDDASPVVLGFTAGTSHDGTFRLRHGAHGPELWCEAFLGDALLGVDERRELHDLVVASGADAEALLAGWARLAGEVGAARVDAPFQVGWCSWYHYFHDVTEADLDANLALADGWPFDVFQLDDGYQSAIGDWLTTNERFPSELDAIAGRIAAAGRRPGIWLAPFLAAPDSEVATRHPDWLARTADGDPLVTMFNPPWEGDLQGFMYGLDTTHPEVVDHLERVAETLVVAGFSYLKLDFTFAPSFDGRWHDRGRTPAERVRSGYEAVRRGADRGAVTAGGSTPAFLLGCGAPLAPVVGVVDGNRIGADVAPSWPVEASTQPLPGYRESQPSTMNAWRNTAARSFMHRRLWLNDPDCLMLRSDETELGVDAARTWATAVAVSGGMALVSDDLALLGPDARRLLDETLELGRTADRAAREGEVAVPLGLLDGEMPAGIASPAGHLRVDPASGRSTLRR